MNMRTEIVSTGSHVSWFVNLQLRPGAWTAFLALTEEMVASTEREPGVLVYERYVSADRTMVSVYERYVDSAAAMSHLIDFRERYGPRFSALAERQSFVVLGEVDEPLKELLSGFGASLPASQYAGFAKRKWA